MLPRRYREKFRSRPTLTLNLVEFGCASGLEVVCLFVCFLPITRRCLKYGVDDLHSPPEPEDEENLDEEETSSRPGDPQGAEAVELSLAAVRHQVDVLLEEWNKSADVLFSIHPMDGSLLVWHVDWLDEYQPGMFRQAQVGSRLTFLVSA